MARCLIGRSATAASGPPAVGQSWFDSSFSAIHGGKIARTNLLEGRFRRPLAALCLRLWTELRQRAPFTKEVVAQQVYLARIFRAGTGFAPGEKGYWGSSRGSSLRPLDSDSVLRREDRPSGSSGAGWPGPPGF